MKPTPIQEVKSTFENKTTLVEKLMGGLERPDGISKDQWKATLLKVPNRKLLKLHQRMVLVRDRFGSREGLVDAICGMMFQGRKVDLDYRAKLMRTSMGRLVDSHWSLQRRSAK